MLHDPFGRSQLPAELMARDPARTRRVRLLAECFQALLEGRLPSDESRLFVAAGGMAWLEVGGRLDRDHWQVAAPRSSQHGPAYLWRTLRDQASSRGEIFSMGLDTLAADNSESTE